MERVVPPSTFLLKKRQHIDMRRVFVWIVLIASFCFFVSTANAQSGEQFSDLQYDNKWSCMYSTQKGAGGMVTAEDNPRKIVSASMFISGICTGQTCDPIICLLPAGGNLAKKKRNEGREDKDKIVSCSEGKGVPLTDELLADGTNPCTKYCYKNGATHFSDDFKSFMMNAAAEQAGGENKEKNNMKPLPSDEEMARMVPKMTFADEAQGYGPERTTFDPGEFNLKIKFRDAHGHVAYLLFTAPNGEIGQEGTATSEIGPTPFTGDANVVQQSQLDFSTQSESSSGESSSRNCTLITWDPYGKVFDAKSLEPLGANDAYVTLLDKDGVKLTLVTQDDPINNFGVYNILVMQDAYYKLSVTPNTQHRFERVILDPKYKDLYDPFIYLPGDPAFFEQKKSPKRVDLPVVPIGNPYTRPIEIARKSQTELDEGVQFIIKTTHPLSLVKFKVNDKVLTDDGFGKPLPSTTTKDGIWMTVIKKDLLSQSGYSIEASKNPLYFGAGSSTVEFNPLLSYIEGYALDKSGRAIPHAKIRIRMRSDKTIYYQVAADANGFFSVSSKHLPYIEYYLEYVDPKTGIKTLKTTSEFVVNNGEYSKSHQINYMSEVSIAKKKTSQKFETYQPSGQQSSLNKINTTSQSNSSSRILPIGIIVGVLCFAFIGVFIYLKQKKQTQDFM